MKCDKSVSKYWTMNDKDLFLMTIIGLVGYSARVMQTLIKLECCCECSLSIACSHLLNSDINRDGMGSNVHEQE